MPGQGALVAVAGRLDGFPWISRVAGTRAHDQTREAYRMDPLRREQDRVLSRSLTVTQFLVAIGTIVGAMVVPIIEATRIIDALAGLQQQVAIEQTNQTSLQRAVEDLTIRVARMEVQMQVSYPEGGKKR